MDYNAKTEEAIKAKNDALVADLDKAGKLKWADLKNNLILIKEVTDYDGVTEPIISVGSAKQAYVPQEHALLFYAREASATQYELDWVEISDDYGKGKDSVVNIPGLLYRKAVVAYDVTNKMVTWARSHQEQRPFERDFVTHIDKVGDFEPAQAMLSALQAYIKGTYNLSGYDSRLISYKDFAHNIVTLGSTTDSNPTSGSASAPTPKPSSSSASASPASSASPTGSQAKPAGSSH